VDLAGNKPSRTETDSLPFVNPKFGGFAPATPGFNALFADNRAPEALSTSGVSALVAALRSHPCVALSSARAS
jgi:hypothetical protein